MLDEIFTEKENGVEFIVYLIPGAKKEDFTNIFNNEDKTFLKISIHARPTDNQANEALIKFLSAEFKVAKSNIIIKRGIKSRIKQIFVSNFKISSIPQETYSKLKLLNFD